MKRIYIDEIKNALKSKEYWFGFSIIVISSIITAIYNLSSLGIFGSIQIGGSEFFMAGTMHSNTLLRISAPVIAIFVCMNRNSLLIKDEKAMQRVWKSKKMKAHIMACATIGGSVFLISFLLLIISGVILFPSSSGSMPPSYGLFKEVYQSTPIGYILLYILHSFVCGAVYAFFGISIKAFIAKPNNIVLFIPLVFYSCFIRLGWLFPFFNGPISYVSVITIFDIPLIKRVAELSFVLVISMILIFIGYHRSKKKRAIKLTMFNIT